MSDEIIKAETNAIQQNEKGGIFDTIASDVYNLGFWASFPTEGRAGGTRLYNATNSCISLADMGDRVINLIHVVFKQVQFTDERGRSSSTMGVYLIDENGVSYLSASSGVVRSALDIVAQFGLPETWADEGPLPVQCVTTETKRGMRYKFLKLA